LVALAAGCAPTATTTDESAPALEEANPQPVSTALAGTASTDPVKTRLELAIQHIEQRELLTTNAFWTVFHGILGVGPNLMLKDPESGQRVNALDYIFRGEGRLGEIRGLRFVPTAHGINVHTGPIYVGQGHQDQFVGEIAQWGVPIDTKVLLFGKEYTLRDFLSEIKAHARVGQELSWTIVALGHYYGTDLEWTNSAGEKLRLEDLVKEEVNASIDQAACGGTHRLFGLTWVYHIHRRKGGKEEGVWKEVADKLAHHQALAKKYQNSDGSLSSNYFRGPGLTQELQERLGSSGHTLEWLASALSDEELQSDWMQNAANAVALMVLEAQSAPVESGALYHAAHGLATYYVRRYGEAEFKNRQLGARPHRVGASEKRTPSGGVAPDRVAGK
jgi:hypothetical protein